MQESSQQTIFKYSWKKTEEIWKLQPQVDAHKLVN